MYNKIVLLGRLVKDPELRRTQSNMAVTSFTMAVDRQSGKDGAHATDFIDCVAWDKTGEFVAKYFGKGQKMLVDGRLQCRDWEDKQGQKRRSWEVVVRDTDFADSKREPSPLGADDFQDAGDDDGELLF